jgi:phage gp29-like protein
MVNPVPDFMRKAIDMVRRVGRPSVHETESMVDVGSTLRSYQPIAGRRQRGIVEILPVDEIITRKGWKTYRDMMNDPQIVATLEFKKLMVMGRKWDVEPASKDQKDVDVAEFVAKALRQIDLKSVLKESLSALEWGFCLGELIWKVGKVEGNKAIVLKDIRFRDPEYITFHADAHGNIKKWEQDVKAFGVARGINSTFQGEVFLEPNKVFHYAHNSQFGQHYGKSDLRACYRSWWAKKFVIQFFNVYLERMGAPLTTIKYPQGASSDLKDTLKNILKGLSSKSEILIPAGVEIELIEAMRSGKADYDAALDYHDREIARAMLMVALLGAGGNAVKRGSDSQSRIHLRTLHKMADELGFALLEAFNQQVVKQLVDFNFDVEAYPKVFFQDYGEFEAFEITDAVRLLHSAGILELDQEDVNFTRSILGLPVRDEGDEDKVVRPPEPPPPGSALSPPPAAAQGNANAESGAAAKASPSQGANKA